MSDCIISKTSSEESHNTFYFLHNQDNYIEVVHIAEEDNTYFRGKASGNLFQFATNINPINKILNLCFRAIDNRTIERNYFRLYSEMLEGDMSESEFYSQIQKNEDNYVILNDIVPSDEDLRIALYIASKVKDVMNSEDLSSLFSFNSEAVDKQLQKIEFNGDL